MSLSPKAGCWEQVKVENRLSPFLSSSFLHLDISWGPEARKLLTAASQAPVRCICTSSLNWKWETSQLTLLSSGPGAQGFHNLGKQLLQHGFRNFTVWLELRYKFGSRLGMWFGHVKNSHWYITKYILIFTSIVPKFPTGSWQIYARFR